ncbi:tRNA-uridine aminocarboxypropyltransferase [Morganella psychrotolerans]|uniref:tRNA-uridine aminocarboxypropyltransferase n=1 Tax=Morganella psychrotolerans TaxID=368603 RepID=A0A1B8HRL7_9GAMM|nr:tRNA-uridine aminocarboxypropyltransferase [Morganella psychrotolerans]OBU12253.1 DTW domain-containing protein [Morganella psychrotolerans]
MKTNSVHQLRQRRLMQSTRPFRARGCRVTRCNNCLLPEKNCLCDSIKIQPARSQFCLLMYDTEPLKPSNTGKLIADILPDTQAFLWSRTEPDDALLTLLRDPSRQPYLIFPQAYATPPRRVFTGVPENTRPPLFILLDGTWPEARKMFRKSPYLNDIPLLSINDIAQKDYLLRVAAREDQHCTAEVAAAALIMAGDKAAGKQLLDHFIYFRYQYLKGKSHLPVAQIAAQEDFLG